MNMEEPSGADDNPLLVVSTRYILGKDYCGHGVEILSNAIVSELCVDRTAGDTNFPQTFEECLRIFGTH